MCRPYIDTNNHKGLNRCHRGHTAYIPHILTRDETTNVTKPQPVLFQAWTFCLRKVLWELASCNISV
jgi:hypothetical protein